MADPARTTISGPGGSLAVTDWGGSGRPVVLVHGVFASADAVAPIASALRDRHRVVGYDLRGHGASDRGDPSLTAHVADLHAVLDALGLGRAVLVGIAWGAYVAVAAAVARPQGIAGVVNIEGQVGDRPLPDEPEQVRRELTAGVRRSMTAEPYTRAPPLLEDAVSIVVDSYMPFDWRYTELTVPMLVVLGSGSRAVNGTPEKRQAAARALVAAHDGVELTVLEGGHDLVAERPDAVLAAIGPWLAARSQSPQDE